MPSYNQAGKRLCSRCQQPLPEGSGYCVACGFQNPDDMAVSRQLTFKEDMKRERQKTTLIDWIMLQFWGR
jgi:predicted amidophosphoribosyltransferase